MEVVQDYPLSEHAQTLFDPAHSKAIFDNIVEAVILTDITGNILYTNKACINMFGYAANELLGQNVSMLMPPSHAPNHESYITQYLQTGQASVIGRGRETHGQHKNGKLFEIGLSLGEVKTERGHSFVGIVRDISHRKKAEQRLKQSAEKLRLNNEELDDFVYVVSHDLKEPLRGISAYAQFLRQDYASILPPDGQDKLATIINLTNHFGDLIDRLLFYTRLERTGFAFDKTDIAQVAHRAGEMFENLIKEGALCLDIQPDMPPIWCDEMRLEQVFVNLIGNAIKYNDNDIKKVTITYAQQADECVVSVSDNGIGIPPKFHKSVFRIFKRLHARDAYGGGTGCGLSIVKKIMDYHAGHVEIISDGTNGTSFNLYFPMRGRDAPM